MILGMAFSLMLNLSGIKLVIAAPDNFGDLQENAKGMVNALKKENGTADFATMDATLLSLNITLGSASSNDKGASLLAALQVVNTAAIEIEQEMNKIIDQVGEAYGSNHGLAGSGQASVKALQERLAANLQTVKEKVGKTKQGLGLKLKELLEGTGDEGGSLPPLSPQEKADIAKEWAKTDPASLSSMMKDFSPEVAAIAQEALRVTSLASSPLNNGDIRPVTSLLQLTPLQVQIQKIIQEMVTEAINQVAADKELLVSLVKIIAQNINVPNAAEMVAIVREGNQFEDFYFGLTSPYDISSNLRAARLLGKSTRSTLGSNDYLSWGTWDDSNSGAPLTDYGYNMYWLRGTNETQASYITNTGGSAVYNGFAKATFTPDAGSTSTYVGTSHIEVQFGSVPTMTGSFTIAGIPGIPTQDPDFNNFSLTNATITGNVLKGTVMNEFLTGGHFIGNFYGPEANAIGASFAGTTNVGKLQGIIVADKQ